jgi:PAS domain S-box-containing protein
MIKRAIKALLLVEDNPGDARLLREMLREEASDHTQLTEVTSMRDAQMHLKERPVDIVLLDLGLPDAQGLDAVRQARLAAPRVPLVVLTGLDDEALASQALQEGAQDYLIKGQIDARSLLRALRYAIERKTMEDALFAEKERAQVTLNCIGDAIACTDISGNLTFLNLVAENLTGWSWEESAGRPMADVFRIVDTKNHTAIPNPMEMALGRDRAVHLPPDSILVRRDGTEIPIEDSVAPIHDRDGRAAGAVIVLRDVSAARAMASQMARSAADLAKQNTLLSQVNGELTALVRSSPIAIYATDPEGVVSMWSPAAERLSGFSHNEALGVFLPIIPEDAIEDVRDRIRRVCEGELASNVVVMARKKDGAMIELSISMGPLTDESGVARGAISLAENVTEAIAERKKIDRMQSEFVSTVSHELRTPLTSIGGSLGLIVGGAAGVLNDRATRLVEIANNNTQRLIRLVNDILDIEKLQSGRMNFRFAAASLDDIIDQAVSATLPYAATFGIALRRVGEGSNVVIKADADRANQAITNLISNAVKFSPTGAEVRIHTTRTGRGVRVSVEDRGSGIPEEFRPRIFQRFAQADTSDMRQRGGSGLGLSIVRQIMERHGGLVSFDSDPGVGTSFHLDFPALAGQDRQTPRASSSRLANRVLVCARDAAVADPIRATLLAYGFEGVLGSTTEEAISEAAKGLVKAAIIDLPFAAANSGDFMRRLADCRGFGYLPVVLICVEPAIRDHFYVSQAVPILAWVSRLAEVESLPRSIRAVKRSGKFAILHVEDDRDLLEAVREALFDEFRVVAAPTLEAARQTLARERFELVILDFKMSVGLVKDLFPLVADAADGPLPIILLTAQSAVPTLSQGAEMILVKSQGNLAMVIEAVRSVFAATAPQVHDNQEARHETQSALR